MATDNNAALIAWRKQRTTSAINLLREAADALQHGMDSDTDGSSFADIHYKPMVQSISTVMIAIIKELTAPLH